MCITIKPFKNGGGVDVCGLASKDDSEQSTYISVRSDGDVCFIQGCSAFGARTRPLDGAACVDCDMWTYDGAYTADSFMTGCPRSRTTFMAKVGNSNGADWIRV